MKSISVGIIGLGRIAEIAHLPSLIELKDIEITALCDINEERLQRMKKKYHVISTYKDHYEMLKNEDLDCVFCLTGITEHAEVTIDCLKNGVHVFCEKPLASNLHDAKDMVKASEKAGRWIMIGYNRRFTPVYKKAKDVFRMRKVNLCVAKKCYIKAMPPKYATLNNLIHAIDTVNWFCGEPSSVQGEVLYNDHEEPQTISAIIRYKEGAYSSIIEDHSGGTWIEKLEVYGGGFTAIVRAPTLATTFRNGKEERYNLGATYYYPFHKLYGFQQEDQYFVECIIKDKEPSPSGKDGLKTMELINEIHKKAGLPLLD